MGQHLCDKRYPMHCKIAIRNQELKFWLDLLKQDIGGVTCPECINEIRDRINKIADELKEFDPLYCSVWVRLQIEEVERILRTRKLIQF